MPQTGAFPGENQTATRERLSDKGKFFVSLAAIQTWPFFGGDTPLHVLTAVQGLFFLEVNF